VVGAGCQSHAEVMSARLKGRLREVEQLVRAVGVWAAARSDVAALCCVGSYAYQRPRMSSDVDLIVLTTHPGLYGAWIGSGSPVAPARLIRHQQWGSLTEWRFRRRSGLHVELGVVTSKWAEADPLDPGTARVISDGLQIVYDPHGLLTRAKSAVAAQGSLRCVAGSDSPARQGHA
jgi:uncharacterized protein